ncbi:MAG: GntR family transcriptional regulator [Acidiferrobacterales bacterium]|nr:GntR family transcriptional regulator [Acidiferrobacterales bacterium]
MKNPNIARELESEVKNLNPSIYERMRLDILDGRLKAGEKLTMQALQERYSVGNSPIREALNRLIPDGLVEQLDRRGFFVQKLSRADLTEITKMRCWLADIGIRESIRLGGLEWEETVILAHHRLKREPRFEDERELKSNRKWEDLHEMFHLSLVSACESKWLLVYCKNLLDLSERYRRNDLEVNYESRNPQNEHDDILNAAVNREPDKASELLQTHFKLTTENILRSLQD